MTTTTTAADLAERRERRDRCTRETAAAADLRRIAAAYGEDAAGAAVLAAVESGADSVAACVAAAATGTRSARSMRGTADRAAARDHDRAVAAYGPTAAPARESRTDTTARLIGQRYGAVAADQVRTILTDESHLTNVDRLAAIDAAAGAHVAAVVAAILADGPTTRPDHDPSTCGRESCRRCRRLRQVVGIDVGPLAGAAGADHRRRPRRADRAPAERTTAAAVRILRESHLTSMLDLSREHHATTVTASPAHLVDASPLAVHLVDAFTTAAPGRRGWQVTRPAAVRPQVWRTLIAAAGATVAAPLFEQVTDTDRDRLIGRLAAAAPWSGAADQVTARLALAAAVAQVAPDPTDRLASHRSYWRQVKRAAAARDQVPPQRRPIDPTDDRLAVVGRRRTATRPTTTTAPTAVVLRERRSVQAD